MFWFLCLDQSGLARAKDWSPVSRQRGAFWARLSPMMVGVPSIGARVPGPCRALGPKGASPASHNLAPRKTIVTFDVDGTLVRSIGKDANKLHKEAFAEGLKVLGIHDPRGIDVIEHHGSTDGLILVRTAHYHGLSPALAMDKLPEMHDVMCDYFEEHKDTFGHGTEVLPGVCELLSALSDMPNVYVGLCTGNLEPIGWTKMELLGLKDMFDPFGGFGNLYCSGELDVNKSYLDRAQLIDIAAKRAVDVAGAADVSEFRRIHVGDAPHDVDAAVKAGVFAVGVLTGIFAEEDLRRRCGYDHESVAVLPSLEDTQAVLQVMDLID